MFLPELALGKKNVFSAIFPSVQCLDIDCGRHIYIQIKTQRFYPERPLFQGAGGTVQILPSQINKMQVLPGYPARYFILKPSMNVSIAVGKKLVWHCERPSPALIPLPAHLMVDSWEHFCLLPPVQHEPF